MIRFLWSLQVYFSATVILALISMVDLPLGFYPVYILVLPIYWLGLALEPGLNMLGLWSPAGNGGWLNYEGPTTGGLILVSTLGLVITSVVIFVYKRNLHNSTANKSDNQL